MRRGRRLAALAFVVVAPFVAPGQVPVARAAPCAAGEVQIAVVVDFGDGGSVSTACVGAGSRDNGATVLAARAEQLGTVPPRFDSSGLLCAIDGYPTDGCGDQTGDHYAYWSYWHGDGGGWDYSSVGPAGSRVQSAIVEGWRFQPGGAGNPSDPAPRGSPDPLATCTPPPTAPPPTEAPPTAPAPPGPTSPAVGPSPTPVPGASAPSEVTTTTAPAADAAGGSTTVTGSTSTTTTAVAAATNAAAPPGGGPVQVTEQDGDGPPWGLLGGVAMIGGLGAAGAVVARRRGLVA